MLDYLAYSHQPGTSVLTVRWLRTASPDELRQGYQELLSVAAQHNARFWLLDLRRRGPIGQEFTQWVQHQFFPQAAGLLHGCLHLSYFVSPDHLEQLQEQGVVPREGRSDCMAQFFVDERQATDWLTLAQLREQVA